MKIIDKKQFIPTVCVVYTILSIGKIGLEFVMQKEFGNFQANLLVMLLFSFLATLVLSQHYRLDRLPLLLVMALQYVVMIAAVMLFTWLSGFRTELHPDGYHDMFWSFSIPYFIGAAVYYAALFLEVRKANRLVQKLKEREN